VTELFSLAINYYLIGYGQTRSPLKH